MTHSFFSYGFRPFFLGAAVFAGVAIPVWVLILGGAEFLQNFSAPREWHVHEMLFGFLPAIVAGFLFTAMPNWTDRPPIQGRPLMCIWSLWLAERLAMIVSWPPAMFAAIVDGAFFIAMALIVWREILLGQSWDRAPIGVLITVYASANVLYHVQILNDAATGLPERLALAVVLLLLTFIGGRVTPGFTSDFLSERGLTHSLSPFSRLDSAAILLTAVVAIVWLVRPESAITAWLFIAAGLMNLFRLWRWHGWMAWREPLVLILHVGYGWLALSLLLLGGSMLDLPIRPADAVHGLTTGAVGAMTLAIMTRASLGHTGLPRHADTLTVVIYALVNLGALLRVFGPGTGLSMPFMLGLSAAAWSGVYLLFAFVYGPYLLRPNLDGE